MRIAVWYNLPSGGGKRALYDHVRGLVGLGPVKIAASQPVSVADVIREIANQLERPNLSQLGARPAPENERRLHSGAPAPKA